MKVFWMLRTPSKTLLVLVFALFFQWGCYATTQIQSSPANADVVMDGKSVLGKTPIQLTEMAWVWTDHSLLVSKKGYAPAVVRIKGEFRPIMLVPCFCTLGVALPMVLIGEYAPSYFVTLEPDGIATLGPIQEDASVNFTAGPLH